MVRSLQSGNRAEAWYEIRYGSSNNGADGAGVVRRRFAESELFGLYNDTASVFPDEAKQAYRSFTLHRARIADYEKRYGVTFDGTLGSQGNLIAQATTHYGLTGTNAVDYIHEALNPAYQSLFADLQTKYPVGMTGLTAADFNPVNVFLDPGRDNTKQSIDPNNHAAYLYSAVDPLTGAEVATRDILIGEGGNDVLYGGKGDDVLIGGTGLDYYIWNTGDGNDRIIDEDRQGIIVINDGAQDLYAAGAFVKQGSTNIWKKITPEGVLTLTHNSPWKIVTADGSEILLGDDFADGDFGINLVEETAPATSTLIIGDFQPLDTKPADAGFQPGYDANHNLITDVGQTEARQDILYGGTGNDLIQGLTGTDYLDGRAGDDLLEGGTGNDALAGGQGADVLKGEDGNDILLGDHELATVDSYDYTQNASLIANITHTPDGQGVLVHSYQISIGSTPSPAIGGDDVIEGGLGDDIVLAGGGDDQVDGGDGADVVFGEGGRDIIEGGIGNDILVGDSYGVGVPYDDDTLSGGDGADWLYGTGGNDYLEGGNGNDVLFGDGNGTLDEGADVLIGGDGDDSFYGGGKNDVLIGGADNDTLRGEDGDDILIGGAGVDTLIGGAGNDTLIDDSATGETANLAGGTGDDLYQLGGAGDVNLYDNEGYNTLALAAGDSLEGATLALDTDQTGYRIALANGRALNIQNGFFGTGGSVQDGSGMETDLEGWVGTAITANLALQLDDAGGRLYGGAGADTLYGGTGSDTLAGHKGNDSLQGGAGNDVYEYNLGDGQDTIIETGGNNDVLRFGEGILPERVRVVRWWSPTELDSLRLEMLDENRNVNGYAHIKDYFLLADSTNKVDRIEFADGTVWTDEYIRSVVLRPTEGSDSGLGGFAGYDLIDGLGGDDWINGKAGNDILHGGDGDDDIQGGLGNDTLTGGAGNDRLRGNGVWLNDSYAASNEAGDDVLGGGAGNDLMYGGNGADVYLFGRGDGHDAAIDSGTDGKVDVLRLGAGVLPGHVAIYDSSVLVIDGSSTQISIGGIERIEFDNGAGAVWLAVDIAANTTTSTANAMTGTAGNDTFIVDHGSDTIAETAGGGVDTVLASTRYTLPLNVENITLTGPLNVSATGNALDNILIGNTGNNTLDGKDGTDIAYGGQGDDWYVNVEQIVEYAGEGIDTWYSPQGGTLLDNVENLYMGKYGPVWVPPGYESISYSNSAYSPGTAIGNDLDNVLVSPGNGSSYNVLDGRAGADTMITTGFDNAWFYVDNPGDKVIASASGGVDSVVSSISYTLGDHLEQLYLTGDTPIEGYGNNLNNVLYGYILYGPENTAANVLAGGLGDDTYYLGVGDRAVELAGEGTDKAVASTSESVTFTKADLQNIESFEVNFVNTEARIDLLALGDFDQIVVSAVAPNVVMGLDGNDVLIGRGNNTLIGGLGDDRYYAIENDVIVEDSGGGIDMMLFFKNPLGNPDINMMAENVEEAYSMGLNVNIAGNAGDNYIQGDDGVNYLDGGLGTDVLAGGLGNDSYIVDEAGDQVVEAENGGNDRVYTTIDFTLQSNIENLMLLQSNLTGTGNALGNVLTGSAGDDMLIGLAGDDVLSGWGGSDTLIGGTGSDRYMFGDGSGVIEDFDDGSAGVDTLEIYIQPDNVTALMDGQYLKLFVYPIQTYTWSESGELGVGFYSENQISIRWDAAAGAGIERVEFGNGTVWDAAMLEYKAMHHAPIKYESIGDLYAAESLNFTYTFPSYLFVDVDPGDVLTWSVALDSGQDLPAWLSFDPNSRTLSGIPPTASNGQVALRVTATDTSNASVSDTFMLNLATAIVGTETADTLTGMALNEILYGLAGDDTLSGGGGNDALIGGLGNDTFVINDDLDAVIENPGEGIDIVLSAVDYSLPDNVENLTLTGTGNSYGIGNMLDNVLTGNSGINDLDGGEGDDTYVVSTSDIVFEYENGGTDTVLSAVTWMLDDNIENLTLTGTVAINGTGNTLDNILTGNSVANTLSGGTGADTLIGGTGNDTYVVDNALDVVIENASQGTDIIKSSVTRTLDANVENLTLTGTAAINGAGNTLNNVLTGNSAANTLSGLGGNDTLNGGAGADTLIGGIGNDIYVVDNVGDVVTENLSEGTDTVQSGIAYTLGANLEKLTLTGTTAINGTGNELANTLTGNSAANTLTGLGGSDTLNGGAGADILIGGAGNDIYVVDNVGDVVTESLNEGTDTVQSSITYTLGANLEKLTLTGTAVINGTGNELANTILGNSGANTLSGGAGNDTLQGGKGSDTYLLGLGYGLDTVVENDATAGNTDVAQFLSGVAADQIWFQHVGNNLEASIIGTSDKLVVKDWYLASANHVEQFRTTDGAQTLIDSNVQNLVNAMASFAPPAAGQTTLPQNYQDALAGVIAANWQ